MSRINFIPAPRKDLALIYRNPVFKSMGRNPMQATKQTDLALAARIAFESIQRGQCTQADRDTLACVVNVCMVLAEWHCTPEDLATILAAQEGMLRADGRVLQGKHWNFDADGRQHMLSVLDIHEQLIAQLGQTVVTEALMEVLQRRVKGQVHRVEVKS